MLGKMLARITPGKTDVTDPEVIAQYRQEERERRRKIEVERPLVNWLTDNLAAAVDRNHFGPDIDLALQADHHRKR